MKLSQFLKILLFTMFLSACTLAETPGDQNTAYPGANEGVQQTVEVDLSSSLPYPEYQDGDAVSAGVVINLLNNGAVVKATLKSNDEVIIFLNDGRSLTIVQPFDNAIRQWIEECGDTCKAIEVVEE